MFCEVWHSLAVVVTFLVGHIYMRRLRQSPEIFAMAYLLKSSINLLSHALAIRAFYNMLSSY